MVHLSPGFKIAPREMEVLSNKFKVIGAEYRNSLKKSIAIPRGGGVGIDRAMATALKTINEMHTVLCEAIESHGRKLDIAATNFENVEAETKNAVAQIGQAVKNGLPLSRAESNVVGEYLEGRPAYMTPGSTETPTIHDSRMGAGPDGNPMLAKIPDATKSIRQGPWIQFQFHIIDFDYAGLKQLVYDLSCFIENGDPEILQLSRGVAEFCSPYKNYGDTVYQFNATYSEDASLASGFHKVVATIGATIESFANSMAEKEAWLESYAHRCQIPDDLLGRISERQDKEQILQYFRDAVGKTDANRAFGLFVAACLKVLRQAEDLRKQTAGQLVVLAETITTGGLDYYTKKDVHPTSVDPYGLFNDGNSPHAAITKQLEAELAEDGKRLKDSPNDAKHAIDDISKIGEYGGKIGGIIGGIQSVRNGKGPIETAQNVGNLTGTVGPVLETLGLLIFAE